VKALSSSPRTAKKKKKEKEKSFHRILKLTLFKEIRDYSDFTGVGARYQLSRILQSFLPSCTHQVE
jgi:hypothetical protein